MFGSDIIKLDQMDVMNFTRWNEKMKFLLTAFKNEKGNDKKREGTWNSSKDNKKDKKPLSEVLCYKCGEKGHIKHYYKNPKKKNQNLNKKDESANELHMASVTTTTNDWWYDSGVTTHVCNNKDLFKTYKETEDGHEVMMADNHTSKVIGSRNIEIQFTSEKKLTIMNVLHVPNIRKNLVSGFKLCKSRVKAVIESDKVIMSKANVFVGKAYACDGMFKLNINKITSFAYLPDYNFISSFNIECSTFNLWHKVKCEICVQEKMKRKPFPKVDRQSRILELVHSDICKLNGQLTRGGNRYFITFIDDCSRYTYVYLLKSKDQAFETFKIYKAEVENQRGKIIQILRSDRGGEYFSTEFFSFCESQGLIHQRTAPYTPQQNNVTERKNKVLQDMINAMFVSANLPKNLWGKAFLIACYVSNRIIANELNVSPYEIWKGHRGLKNVFVGYAKDSKSYRCLDLDSYVIIESRDVDFFKNKFRHDSTSINEIVTQIPQTDLNSNNKRNMTKSSSAPKRSERARKERNLDPYFIHSQDIMFLVEGDNENNVVNKIPILLNVEDAPKTYKEAITSRNSAFTRQLALHYDRFPALLEGYSDASWIIGSSDSKFTTARAFFASSGSVPSVRYSSNGFILIGKAGGRDLAERVCLLVLTSWDLTALIASLAAQRYIINSSLGFGAVSIGREHPSRTFRQCSAMDLGTHVISVGFQTNMSRLFLRRLQSSIFTVSDNLPPMVMVCSRYSGWIATCIPFSVAGSL
ncbi:retrovirus-related pol polyprotein from transposon TNT 1-94 [Tanacetum coccineum]